MRATLVATKLFDARVSSLLAADELARLEYAIACDPTAHPVIPGTGGARKMRWTRAGMGKRGGIRVVYVHVARANIVLLITAYAKNVQENLTDDQKKAVRNLFSEFVKSLENN